MATPPQDINLCGIFVETRRIIQAYRNHFSIISLVFLLPFFVLLLICPSVFSPGFQSNDSLTNLSCTFLLIFYVIATFMIFTCAIGTITYSSFHGYYNRPLELTPTLKSLKLSFIPLCSTMIVSQLIYSSIGFFVFIHGVVIFLWLFLAKVDISGNYFLSLILAVLVVFVFVTTYLKKDWVLSNVVVVVESKWGYEPLRRSAYLMEGMRMMASKMVLLFGLPNYVIVWFYYFNSVQLDTGGFWVWLFKMVASSCCMTVLMEYSLVANVVLYIYCKKMHGELVVEVQKKEYVSLPSDDDGNNMFMLKDSPPYSDLL